MRRLSSALLATSLALAACAALARAAATYNVTVAGSQTASSQEEGVALHLNASGDLSGMLRVSLKHEGHKVVGGSWTLTVLPAGADASASERGQLSGSVGGGSVTVGEHGVITGASSVQLTVQGGTGEYAGVSSGGGTLSLSADPENSTKLGGPLALNF